MGSRCFAVTRPVFGPSMRLILSITNANPAAVTTSLDGIVAGNHGYITGTKVRLDIPPACGMQQANQLVGSIVVTGLTTFTIDIDTSTFEPFSIPVGAPPSVDICAQCVPVGEINEILTAAVQNLLPY